MKWILPKIGEKRIITVFLWSPLEINGERRWFEKVKIEQVFIKEIHDVHNILKDDKDARYQPHIFSIPVEMKWANIGFIDDVSEEKIQCKK